MEDQAYKIELNELSKEQDSHIQKDNIIQEIEDLGQEIRDSKYKTFNTTTYWHQQATTMEDIKQENLQKEMLDCLLRIEEKLTQLVNLLER